MQKTLLALALAAAAIAPAQAALTTGDLAFTSLNASEDGWAMVAFTEIAAGTKVYFTDNEWSGSAFNAGESYQQWDSGSTAIAAGTVIRFSNIDTTALKSSVGTFTRGAVSGNTNYGVNKDEDTVYAYIATSITAADKTFLSAIANNAFGTTAVGNLTNTGLAINKGAIQLSAKSDFAEYTGARTGLASMEDYKALVQNVANWTDKGDINAAAASLVPDTTAFTVTSAVPEPQTYAMLLAGLGAIGFVARRRAAK